MQVINISGTLVSDSEKCKDRNGRSFSRFTVTCGSNDINGRTVFTHYRCICYVGGYDALKKGDQVFVSGRFSPSVSLNNEGREVITSLNVMVHQITGGYRAVERKDKR